MEGEERENLGDMGQGLNKESQDEDLAREVAREKKSRESAAILRETCTGLQDIITKVQSGEGYSNGSSESVMIVSDLTPLLTKYTQMAENRDESASDAARNAKFFGEHPE